MKAIASWFASNPVAANLMMLLFVVGGLVSLSSIKIELFPEFSLDRISVSVVHPGASPEEVEEGICIRIEEEVHGIEGVDSVTSTAVEGLGTVLVEVATGADPRRVLDDVKARVDAIEAFPEDAEKPVVQEVLMRTQVINVAVYGEVPERTLKELGERVRDGINALEGISQVELATTRDYEVSIEVSEHELRRLGLDFDDVVAAVRASSVDLSGGTLKTGRGEVVLRTKHQAYVGAEFERLVLRTRPDGSRILLGDVARVVDGFEDTDQSARFEGLPAVMVQVFRVGDESALDVARKVREYVADLAPSLPAGLRVETWQDSSVWLQSRLDLLLKNGAQGLVLVFLVLALFLRFRLSFWVTMGIPISFLGTVMVMPSMGQSINMLSLFAFILVLGIVVDDAIVVGESIYQEQEKDGVSRETAQRGVRAVAVPVVFAVLTTIAAFTPMVGLPGVLGKFFAVIPLAVIPALAFSLVESQLILPAHLSHASARLDRLAAHAPFRWWSRLREAVSGALVLFVQRVYKPLLELAMEWRYATVAVALATMILLFGAVGGGLIKYAFFNDIEGDILAVQVTMPQGTSAATTGEAVQRIERAAEELEREYARDGEPTLFKNFMASIGEQPYLTQQTRAQGGRSVSGSQYGEVVIELVAAEERDVGSNELLRRWRELSGAIPGAVEVDFSASIMSAGDPIEIQLSGNDTDRLKAAAEELKAELARYPGVFDVRDSFRGGKEELVLDVLPSAEAFGISRRDLATQVRQGFYGEEAQRIQRGRDDVKVMVRYPERDRRTLASVEDMRVRAEGGMEVPFSQVATGESRRGYATIQRIDRRRTVNVTADVDPTIATPGEILDAMRGGVVGAVLERHPGVGVSYEGQSSEQSELAGTMLRSAIVALFVVYALLAIPFGSYLQPFIVMSAIPFGVVGAIVGHAVLGISLSILSVLGIAALAGVAVNDSLVLVDFVNREREAGRTAAEAARVAGVLRFRPVLLTSLTTFVGLMPLMLERSVQAQFLVPMAVSLAFGVVFSTAVTLFFVPCAYLILEDLRRGARWLFGRPRGEGEARPAGQAGL